MVCRALGTRGVQGGFLRGICAASARHLRPLLAAAVRHRVVPLPASGMAGGRRGVVRC
jgi:hypothetical protein